MIRSSTSSSSLHRLISSSSMSSPRFNRNPKPRAPPNFNPDAVPFRPRGRGGWHRGFCHQPRPFVSGDAHLDAVRDANYGHRQGYGGNYYSAPRGGQGQDYRQQPPPPSYGQHQRPQFQPRAPSHRPDDHRNWVYAVSQPPPQCQRFTVLSYNILADYLARDHRSKLYFHIPHYILDWEWRKKRLFIEFGLWSPDIMCLQEVDRFPDLEEELRIRGYAGIWKMRTGNAVDGCAIFWRTNRFQLRHEEHIEFNKHGLRDNVAQICVFETRNQHPAENSSPTLSASSDQSGGVNQIVVCNIHVLYNPKRGEIKLGQVRMLLDRAYAISRTWNNAPVIVCGDFNATPESPLYKFISEQKLNLAGLARNQVSGQQASAIYAPRPYVHSNLYRPQQSVDKSPEPIDVKDDDIMGIDNHQKAQNSFESSSEKEKPSTHELAGNWSGELLSDSQNPLEPDKLSPCAGEEMNVVGAQDGCSGDDTLSPSGIELPQRKNEDCNVGNVGNQSIASESSKSEIYSEESQQNQKENNSANQWVLSIRNTLGGHNPELNDDVPSELVNRELDGSSDRELCQELQDLLHQEPDLSRADLVTSAEPSSCERLPKNLNGNLDKPVRDSQSDTYENETLFDESALHQTSARDFGTSTSSCDMSSGTSVADVDMSVLVNTEASPALAAEDKVGTDISGQTACRVHQVSSSTGSSLVNVADRSELEDLLSNEDRGHIDSVDVLPFTDRSAVVDKPTAGHNTSVDSKSGRQSEISDETVCADQFNRELMNNQYDVNQDAVSNEPYNSDENPDPNFLRELLGTDDQREYDVSCETNFSYFPENKSGKTEASVNTSDSTTMIQDDIPSPVASPDANTEFSSYNPYLWTPMEIEAASGNAGCSLVEHQLKLRSAYADVKDRPGTMSTSKEPEVTSYHRQFMGTVDYIWFSEGLQTVKALDTIPKHVLQRTPGFPTRKWGSDHLALVCQLAFTKVA